jgi:hypothetical protein
MRRRFAVRSVVVVVGLSVAALVAAVPSGSGVQTSGGLHQGRVLGAAVHEPPTPVPGTDKRRHLAYEILVENRAGRPIRFDRLQVRDPLRRRVLAVYQGREILGLMVGPDGQAARRLAPGESGAMFLDLSLGRGRRAPRRLAHRFVLSLGAGDRASRRVVARAAITRVGRKRPLRLGPPLHGERLAVFGCCGAVLGHRRALMEVDGRLSLSQR